MPVNKEWTMPVDGKQPEALYLSAALDMARLGEGHTRPNPPVGAVIVRDGKILGGGYHRKAGGDHAEVAAIKAVTKRFGAEKVRGATICVTLEPCSKPGRVGACTDAIIAAGIKKVLYAVPDPNPVNRGRAKRVLAKAEIECLCYQTDLKPLWKNRSTFDECWLYDLVEYSKNLIAPFAKRITTGLPFVTVKLAMSLDGRICDDTGNAKWISSETSRKLTGWTRSAVDAVMVGAETVRKDDPSLLCHQKRNDDLIRVVVSRSGKLPKNAQVFTDGKNPTLVFKDPKTALEELGRMGCLHVFCEGGLELARSLADLGLVDQWWLITAPIVIGHRPISEALRFKMKSDGYSDPYADEREGTYFKPSRKMK